MSHLVLGTAQLGMKYGVANTTGQPDVETVVDIIRVAWEGGIRAFDTAQAYGESERALGRAFRALGITEQVEVTTKLAKDIDVNDEAVVVKAVKGSLDRLGVPILHAVLLHTEGEIGRLPALLSHSFTRHIGLSVYSPERALKALEMEDMSMLQMPGNVLDRRFERAGIFEGAKERGVQVYLRSVFLQGLLLIDPEQLPSHLKFALPVIQTMASLAHRLRVSSRVLALQYVKQAFPDAHVIIGAETPQQVQENISLWKAVPLLGIIDLIREAFDGVDERVVDPRMWPKG